MKSWGITRDHLKAVCRKIHLKVPQTVAFYALDNAGEPALPLSGSDSGQRTRASHTQRSTRYLSNGAQALSLFQQLEHPKAQGEDVKP